jgi:uridine kinase
MPSSKTPFIVGISGGSAAGKTMVAGLLAVELADLDPLVIEVDRYFVDRSLIAPEERSKINYDTPSALDFDGLARDIANLKKGRSVSLPRYDYVNHQSTPNADLVKPAPLIIVEGILLFHPAPIKPLLDFRLFVEADRDTRLQRRCARDTVERGRTEESVILQFNQTVEPAFLKYTAPTKGQADFTLDWNLKDMQALWKAAMAVRAGMV